MGHQVWVPSPRWESELFYREPLRGWTVTDLKQSVLGVIGIQYGPRLCRRGGFCGAGC